MKTALLGWLALAILSSGGARSPSVETVEHERLTAVLHGDVATLDRILAVDWISTTASGDRLTKQQYLDQLRSGTRRFVSLDHADLLVTRHAPVAIITGRTRAVVRDGGVEREVNGRFTHVYLHEHGRWIMLAAHTNN